MTAASFLFMGIMLMLGAIVRELRLIRQHLGGHVAFLPWNED